MNHFSLNLSAVSKDNENPSDPKAGVIVPANVSFVTNIKNRFYSGSLDWVRSSVNTLQRPRRGLDMAILARRDPETFRKFGAVASALR